MDEDASLFFLRLLAIFLGGAVAQSGERLTGSQKVVGSNPISSTSASRILTETSGPWRAS